MIFDDMLFPKTTQRSDSCEPTVAVMGINMGICLILTAIVAIAAILGCMLLLICVKFVTDRDERRAQNRRLAVNGQHKSDGDGVSAISGNTTTSYNTDERAGLTKIIIIDENDI